jgi:DivIVA domain-containing protein
VTNAVVRTDAHRACRLDSADQVGVVHPTRFRPGYDERAVDDFLDAVIASLAPSSVPFTSAQIRERVLPHVRVKGGYDIEEFDEFRGLIAEAVQLLH